MAAWYRSFRALFVAYVAATAVHIGWVMAHEPFSFDAWNVANDTRGAPITLGAVFHVLEVRVHALQPEARPAADLPRVQGRRVRRDRDAARVRRARARRRRDRARPVAELAARSRPRVRRDRAGLRVVHVSADRQDDVLPRVRRELSLRRGDPDVVPRAAAARAGRARLDGKVRCVRARRHRGGPLQRAHRANAVPVSRRVRVVEAPRSTNSDLGRCRRRDRRLRADLLRARPGRALLQPRADACRCPAGCSRAASPPTSRSSASSCSGPRRCSR